VMRKSTPASHSRANRGQEIRFMPKAPAAVIVKGRGRHLRGPQDIREALAPKAGASTSALARLHAGEA
jgi:hypothetical protein